MRSLNEALAKRVLLTDGSIDWRLERDDFNPSRDFFGSDGVVEVLNLSRRRLVRSAHEAYLRAGADVIRCNTLGASPLTLGAHGLGDDAFCINYAAAEIACSAVDAVPGQGRRRFVLGVIRDDGWRVAEAEIEDAVALQSEALIAGGVDGIALEVTPGLGRTLPFLRGARRSKESLSSEVAIFLFQDQGASPSPNRGDTQLIRFHDGSEDTDFLLGPSLQKSKVNLTGGGTHPEQTAALDDRLREAAEDGLRPFRGAARPGVIEEPTVPSSARYIEPDQRAWA